MPLISLFVDSAAHDNKFVVVEPLELVDQLLALNALLQFQLQEVLDVHVLELEVVSEDTVLPQEVANLSLKFLYLHLTLPYEGFFIFLYMFGPSFLSDFIEYFRVEHVFGHMLADSFDVSESRVQPLSSVDHEQSVFAVWNFVGFPKYFSIVDVRHLPRQFPNRELAVSIQVFESGLTLPVLSVLLQKGFDVVDLVLRHHFDVSFSRSFLHKPDVVFVACFFIPLVGAISSD